MRQAMLYLATLIETVSLKTEIKKGKGTDKKGRGTGEEKAPLGVALW
jgi:hypothetical protein